MIQKTAEDVYNEFGTQGAYAPKKVDNDFIHKILKTSVEDIEYNEFLLQQKTIRWKAIFMLYYHVLRELCEALVLSQGMKVSNHQACFVYICVKFPHLEFDWEFFDRVRFIRNKVHYEGTSVSEKDWRSIDVQLKLYISTLRKEVEKKL
jgi:hypothetical protein